jgi:hypothetical protein
VQLFVFQPCTDHQDHARLFAGAHEDVVRPGRAVDEVPRPQEPLLLLDEQPALAREHEEVLLLVLGVVEPVRLPRIQNADLDADLRERELSALKAAIRPRRLVLAVLGRHPRGVAHVDDEPAVTGRREA